jgi:ribosome recycling factor
MSNYKLLPAAKIADHFKQRLSVIRAGRVNASILDNVLVEAYETKMHIVEIATVTVPEPGQLWITPFDKSLNTAIEKAIQIANIGANPTNDGAGVRLIFPPMTEENRKAKVKEVGGLLEESKINLRNSRQDLLKSKKHEKEEGLISEDELRRFETELQQEVDQLNKELEEMAKNKEEEVMKV